MQAENPYAPPKPIVSETPRHADAPSLWNPNAAASWSLLFSPIFGSILHMKNWQSKGDTQKAATSKNWAIGTTVFFLLHIVLSVFLPDSKMLDGLSRIVGLAIFLSWYYFSSVRFK